jgi:chromosome segregation ATPase
MPLTVDAIYQFTGVIVGISGIIFGFAAWRRGDNTSAERLAKIEIRLEQISKSVAQLCKNVEITGDRYRDVELQVTEINAALEDIKRRVGELEEQQKECLNKESKN